MRSSAAVPFVPGAVSRRLPVIFVVLACLALDAMLLVPQFFAAGFRPDFGVFWTVARVAADRPDLLYDFEAMTLAQSWLADPALGLRPFMYPPTALLLFAPLRLLSFPVAFVLWTGISLLALLSIQRRLAGGRAVLALTLAAPPVVQALMTGQTTLIVGATIVRGLYELERRPLVAGLLLGIAAAIKPQTLLLLPVAYLRIGRWRPVVATAIAGLAMLVAALPFGPALWIDWLHALPRVPQMADVTGLNVHAISPAGTAAALGLGASATLLVRMAGIGIAVLLVWRAFGHASIALRAAALLCGAFLASPYAMPYELAVLAPVAAAALLRREPARWLAVLPLITLGGVAAVLALAASTLIRTSARPAA